MWVTCSCALVYHLRASGNPRVWGHPLDSPRSAGRMTKRGRGIKTYWRKITISVVAYFERSL